MSPKLRPLALIVILIVVLLAFLYKKILPLSQINIPSTTNKIAETQIASISQSKVPLSVLSPCFQNRSSDSLLSLDPQSTEGKFFLALTQNNPAPLALLDEVIADDPQNSAPFLFKAMIQSLTGDKEGSEKTLMAAQNTDHFDTYVKFAAQSLFQNVKTAQELLTAYAEWSEFVIPDYVELYKYLRTLDSSYWAEQMMADAKNETLTLTDIEWFSLDYVLGRALVKAKDPSTPLLTLAEVVARKENLSPLGSKDYIKFLATCDPKLGQAQIEIIQKRK